MVTSSGGAAFTVFTTGEILFSPGIGSHPSHIFFDSNDVLSSFHTEKTHFAPVFAPTISDSPIFFLEFFIKAPTHHTDRMVLLFVSSFIIENTSLIVKNRLSIDRHCHRASMIDFTLHGVNIISRHFSILLHCSMWVFLNSDAFTSIVREGVARTANINRLTGIIFIRTVAFF